MPIANYLHQQGIDVYICANGAALTLMKMECYYAKFVDDVPFEISYVNNITSNILKLIGQLPKMWKQLYDEHQLLKKIVSQHNIDLVISDHRYGFYHTVVPSIFVTVNVSSIVTLPSTFNLPPHPLYPTLTSPSPPSEFK